MAEEGKHADDPLRLWHLTLTPCPRLQGMNKKEKTQVRKILQVLPRSSGVCKSREQSWEQLFFPVFFFSGALLRPILHLSLTQPLHFIDLVAM